MVGIYLAGAIRSTSLEEYYDRGWRDFVRLSLQDEFPGELTIYDPIRDESHNEKGIWELYSIKSTPAMILHKDLAAIKQSDIIFMNLIPFSPGTIEYKIKQEGILHIEGIMAGNHPSVGTFIEAGIAVVERKLLVVVTDNSYLANCPMLAAAATAQFARIELAVEFTKGLIRTLIGQ